MGPPADAVEAPKRYGKLFPDRALLERAAAGREAIDRGADPALVLSLVVWPTASIDMRQAEAAARLLDRQGDVHVRRALETAIAVCYARPWLESNRDGKLKKRWLPNGAEELRLHDLLMDLRKRTYAHNDPTGGRRSLATLEAAS
jgi:hypothetical protein